MCVGLCMTFTSLAHGIQKGDQGADKAKNKVEKKVDEKAADDQSDDEKAKAKDKADAKGKEKEKADEVVTPALFLKNATLHTMASGGTMVGSIHVENGRIKAIGEDVEAPEGAKVFDLKGFHVTPGLIESRGKLWISAAAAAEVNARAELSVVDAVDPWNEDWKELAAQGITSVYVQPGSASSVGGLGAVLRVGPHGSVENIVMKKDVAIQVSIGTRGRSSKERSAQVKALEALLKSAKDKKKGKDKDKGKDAKDSDKKDKEDKDDNKEEDAEGEDGDKDADKEDKKKDDKDKDEKSKKKDVTKELFKRVLKREIPLFIEVHHSDALKRVLALVKEYKFRVVLGGLSKVGSAADELSKGQHSVVLGPFFEPGQEPSYRKDADFDWFTQSETDEKLWALASFPGSARGSQALRINAASGVRMGLSRDQALKGLTANAARMLGVADQVGSLEAGKQADIAVFAGDPIDSCVPARLVISRGTVIYENDDVQAAAAKKEATEGDEKYVALPARLPKKFVVKTTRLLQDGVFVERAFVVEDGKITSTNPQNTEGMEVYDLGDTVVTPGLVVAHTALGQSAAINDTTESDASHLRAVDAFDPTTKKAKETLHEGFVHIGVAPGANNTSSGAMGHVRLGTEDYVAGVAIANQFVLSGAARDAARFPASLNGQVSMIGNLFDGKLASSRVYLSDSLADLVAKDKLDCVSKVSSGERKCVFLANEKVEIRSVMALAKEHGVHPVLASSGAVGDVADKLAKAKMGLLVTPVGVADYVRGPLQIKTAVQAGVEIGFVGDSADQVRTTASMLVAAGVPGDVVLRGLTVGGAELVGMKDTGIVEGAHADFVVWTGSPLDLASKPVSVVVDGKPVTKK